MKKLLILLTALISLNGSAYTIKNNTPWTFHCTITYTDWWFNHTYTLQPFETISTMNGLSPSKTALFNIYSHVFSHYETRIVNGKEQRVPIYHTYSQTLSERTKLSATIHGYNDNWVITKDYS